MQRAVTRASCASASDSTPMGRVRWNGARIASDRNYLRVRDGRGCARCGAPINMALRGMDPAGPTVGHRVPVAAGGGGGVDNLRLEHRRCNLAANKRYVPDRANVVKPWHVF